MAAEGGAEGLFPGPYNAPAEVCGVPGVMFSSDPLNALNSTDTFTCP
jgi:hypothetical protein